MDHSVLQELLNRDRIAITTHVRPDGDAIGSQLALGLYLRALGKDVALINADPVPDNLDWMPGVDLISVFNGSLGHHERFANADAIVVVDCNASERLGNSVAGPVLNSQACKVLIDHHTEPEEWFDYALVRQDAAATGELIYELIAGHDPEMITGPVATALYVAVLTDTGSFRHDSVTPAVHRLAADLLERGAISPAAVYGAVYETRGPQWGRLLGRVLGTLTVCRGGHLGYMYVSRRMFAEARAAYGDAEGFVEFPLAVDGVDVALLFTETPSGTKISFRSKGSRGVHRWARSFGGGGHRNAAGAYVRRPLDEVIKQVLEASDRFLGLQAPEEEHGLSPEDEAYLSTLMEVT